MATKFKVGFLGAGKMAEGILSAVEEKSTVIMAEKVVERRQELAKKYDVALTDNLAEVAKKAKIIFLSVKPQDVDVVAKEIKSLLKPTQVLVSIVAGKTLKVLRKAFGSKVRLIRVMPNLALRANAGMCAICYASNATKRDVSAVDLILSSAGKTVIVDEKHFDAVTALSGSGPAYFAYMQEAMSEAGVKLGLPSDVARLLAEQTMFGTAKFLRESGYPLKPFIDGVCTKGGTTAAGMEKLAASDFKEVVALTLAAAAKRSKELA